MPFDLCEADIRDNAGHYVPGHTEPGPGRSSKYKDCYPPIAEGAAKLGLTDQQIASTLNVAPSTYYRWQKQYPAFRESVQRGKMIADAKIAAALHRLATGYTITIEYALTREGKLFPLQKHTPPSLKAIKLWLRNRQPEKWKF